MPKELRAEALAIAGEAQRVLAGGDQALPPQATPRPALPVRTLAGALQGWFVPVVAGDRLVAFMRFSTGRVLKGTSRFTRQLGDISTCPLAADWLDEERIRSRASALCAPGEEVGAPRLSFDGAPERFAWAIPLQRPGAEPRWVFVAGTAAWAAGPAGLG